MVRADMALRHADCVRCGSNHLDRPRSHDFDRDRQSTGDRRHPAPRCRLLEGMLVTTATIICTLQSCIARFKDSLFVPSGCMHACMADATNLFLKI